MFDLFVGVLKGVGGPDLSPKGVRERSEGQQVFFGFEYHPLDFGDLPAEQTCDDIGLLGHVRGVGLGEVRADRCGDQLGVALGHDSENIAH